MNKTIIMPDGQVIKTEERHHEDRRGERDVVARCSCCGMSLENCSCLRYCRRCTGGRQV